MTIALKHGQNSAQSKGLIFRTVREGIIGLGSATLTRAVEALGFKKAYLAYIEFPVTLAKTMTNPQFKEAMKPIFQKASLEIASLTSALALTNLSDQQIDKYMGQKKPLLKECVKYIMGGTICTTSQICVSLLTGTLLPATHTLILTGSAAYLIKRVAQVGVNAP